MKTTLNEIRKHKPCARSWIKFLAYLGKAKADDEPVSILTVLDSNGIDDALWCLRAVTGHDREIRIYAVWCARQVQHFMTDERSLAALDVAEKFANGDAIDGELSAARVAAQAAAAKATASDDAWCAAWCAAWAAASDAAWRAAQEAAWSAASNDASDAAWAAANDDALAAQTAELRRVCECVDNGIDPYPRSDK